MATHEWWRTCKVRFWSVKRGLYLSIACSVQSSIWQEWLTLLFRLMLDSWQVKLFATWKFWLSTVTCDSKQECVNGLFDDRRDAFVHYQTHTILFVLSFLTKTAELSGRLLRLSILVKNYALLEQRSSIQQVYSEHP